MSMTKNSQIDACPACDAGGVDTSVDIFDGVCVTCGFVVHDSNDLTVPDWIVTAQRDEQSPQDDWLANCRVQNATEQRLVSGFNEIEELANCLHIPIELRRDAAEIYCDAFLAETTDGRETTNIIAACVRLASLQNNPIPTGRLTDPQDVDSSQFHRNCSTLRDELDKAPPAPEPADYLRFLENELSVDDDLLQASDQLLGNIAGDSSLVGKDPSAIAAAALYLTGEDFTQSNVAESVGVSTETVRKRVAQLRELITDG